MTIDLDALDAAYAANMFAFLDQAKLHWPSISARLRELEGENARLRERVADENKTCDCIDGWQRETLGTERELMCTKCDRGPKSLLTERERGHE